MKKAIAILLCGVLLSTLLSVSADSVMSFPFIFFYKNQKNARDFWSFGV